MRVRRLAVVGVISTTMALSPLLLPGAPVSAQSPPTSVWPEFHGNAGLTGVSSDPTISTANAAELGVARMVPVGPSLGSPTVAWNAALGLTVDYDATNSLSGGSGYLNAVNADTGAILWSDPFGSQVVSTPLVEGNFVWTAPDGAGRIYKVSASTGAVVCSAPILGDVLASPVAATPPGGVSSVYISTLGSGGTNGMTYGITESDCTRIFAWNHYNTPGQQGVWSPLSYAVDATGEGLVLFGSADPDSSIYAIDASTGAPVWNYNTENPAGLDYDVGAGTAVSAPGVNGFADGMAYVDGKNGVCYGLDLTTGALVWSYDFGQGAASTDSLSTPALAGNSVVFGDNTGLYSLDATTGAVQWHYVLKDTIDSSPAIVGPPNGQVVAFGTLGGLFEVVNLSSGALLYSYRTAGYITSSPADVDGNLLINSSDGFLYDFALGGGNGAVPTTAVISPASGTTVANPNGTLTVSGTATAPDGVAAVTVQMEEDPTGGPWLEHGAGFAPGLAINHATLASPGATSTTWTFAVPMPAQGGAFQVLSSAVDADGQADVSEGSGTGNAVSNFTVASSPTAPRVAASPTRQSPAAAVELTMSGFGHSQTLRLSMLDSTNTIGLGTATTSTHGSVDATVTIPAGEPFGPEQITVTDTKSHQVGAAVIDVSNESPQLGYGTTRLGYEAEDSVIERRQAVSASTFLTRAWSFSTTGAIDTTPAIVDGTAYIGDLSGAVDAVTVTSGRSTWTTSLGSAVEASPAVDSGNVFVGDDAGSVVALDATTGATTWSTALGGHIMSSPAVVGGQVYVGSTNGTVDALNEQTGQVTWTTAVPAGVTASLAVDPGTGMVVVADQAGTVTALAAASGAPLWSHTTAASALAAAPVIIGGHVYVGSTNGTVYALAEGTGALIWTHRIGGSITGSMATLAGDLVVPDSNRDVIYLNESSGRQAALQEFPAPVTGVATATGILLASTTAGLDVDRVGLSGDRLTWSFPEPSGVAAAGVILNGEVFAAGEPGQLEVFVIPGNPPN